MNRRRFITLLASALLAIAAALYVSAMRNGRSEIGGSALLPGLDADIKAVTEVSLFKGAATPRVTLRRAADGWTVAQRAGYPADVVKLRALLTALSDAKVIEEKTANPANFVQIGVEDPTEPGAYGVEVALSSPTGKRSVIVGKSAGQGNFVRRGGGNQTFAVEPALSFEVEPKYWIDSRLIDIPAARIQRVELTAAGVPGYVLHRIDPKQDSFVLEAIPAGRKALEGSALAPVSTLLTALKALDVSPQSDLDFSSATRVVIGLTDGGMLTLLGKVIGDKHWIEPLAANDPELNAKSSGRAFEIASYRYDAIFRSLDSLLVTKDPAPAAKPAPPATRNPAVPPIS